MALPASYSRLTVHIKGFFLWLMPLCLFAIEKARNRKASHLCGGMVAGLGAFSLLTVIEPETGVYFWPLLIAYCLGGLRKRAWIGIATGLALSVAYLLWFYWKVIGPSVTKGGRSLASLMRYSPSFNDLFHRAYDPVRIEQYIYPGIALPLAVLGAVMLARRRAPIGRKVFVASMPLIVLAALGPNAPITGPIYLWSFEHISAFRVIQTPGRIIFVIGPMIALGVAVLLQRFPKALIAPLTAVVATSVLLDARAVTFSQSPGLDQSIFRAAQGATAVLDLPITTGIDFHASVYNYETTLLPAPRAGGVSPFVTRQAIDAFNRVGDLGAGRLDAGVMDAACGMKISHVVVWEDLFGKPGLPPDAKPALAALRSSPRFKLVGSGPGLFVYLLRC